MPDRVELMVLGTVLLSGVVPATSAAQRTDTSAVAFTHVTVVDVRAAALRPDQTVLVAGGRIRASGAAGEVVVPDEARRIEASGKFLIPGLWDMHTHPTAPDMLLMVANGVTGARVMWGYPAHLTQRDAIRRGEQLGPLLVVGGPIMEGPPPPGMAALIPTAGKVIVRTADEAAAAVRAQHSQGWDFIKIYNNISREAHDGLAAEARRLGLVVAGHVPFEIGLQGALRSRQASIEHYRGYIHEMVPATAPDQPGADLRSRVLAARYADTSRFRALAEATREAGVWNTPTLSVWLRILPWPEIDEFLRRPEADYLPPSTVRALRNRVRPPFFGISGEDDWERAKEDLALWKHFTRVLHAAGGKLLAGTDDPPFGFSLHRELENLVSAGLAPAEALATATINPAEFLGATDSLGTIAPGLRADLVLLEGNPLADIRNTQRIAAVVLNGRYLSRAELDGLLRDVRARRNTPPAYGERIP